jgi:hypothetical protein
VAVVLVILVAVVVVVVLLVVAVVLLVVVVLQFTDNNRDANLADCNPQKFIINLGAKFTFRLHFWLYSGNSNKFTELYSLAVSFVWSFYKKMKKYLNQLQLNKNGISQSCFL